MAITVNAGRQEVISAVQKIDGATVGAAGAQGGIQLPEGAIVLRGSVFIPTAFTGGADITIAAAGGGLTIGATDADVGTTGVGTVDGSVVGAGGATVDITTGGTTPTGGLAYVVVEYVVAGRAAFSEG